MFAELNSEFSKIAHLSKQVRFVKKIGVGLGHPLNHLKLVQTSSVFDVLHIFIIRELFPMII